jgi:hypothetical protein
VILGPRIEAAFLTAVGVAVAVSYFWWQQLWLPILGVFIAGFGTSALIGAVRRPPALREQDKMVRSLWTLLRKVPSDVVLVDPVTGHEISVERERGFLTLAVADPANRPAGTVTRYMVGFAAAPTPPPLLRHTAARHDESPVRMSIKQAGGLLHFNELTGAMETSNDELVDVRAQLDRAIAAAREGP